MLHVHVNLILFGSRQIDDIRQRVNVQSPGQDDGNNCADNEGELPLVVSVSEQGNADVHENEVLTQEVQEVEDLFCLGLRLF